MDAAIGAKAAAMGAAMAGEDSGPSESDLKAEQQRQEYLKRGIHMTEYVEDPQEPYFINLDPDPYRNERIMYIFDKGETTFGTGSADIYPMGIGIKDGHCKVVKTEGANLKIVGGKGDTFVNGKKLKEGQEVSLVPKDRIAIGHEVLTYRHPGNPQDDGGPVNPEEAFTEYTTAAYSGGADPQAAAKAKEEADAAHKAEMEQMESERQMQMEAMQAEFDKKMQDVMAQNNAQDDIAKLKKQLEDQQRAAEEAAAAKFAHDLMLKQAGTLDLNQAEKELRELLPLTQDLNNRVFKMMDRSFLSAEATVQTKPMEVKVKITRSDTNESITLQKHSFLTAHTLLMQQCTALANAVGSGKDWALEHETNDPVNLFFDNSFDLGVATNFTMSLAYNLGTEDDDGILVINRAIPPCDEIGKLEVSWEPIVTKMVDGEMVRDTSGEPDNNDDPMDLIGKEWAAELKIRKVNQLPFQVSQARVKYEFYNFDEMTTDTVEFDEGTNNPEWDYSHIFHVPVVTNAFLQYLQNAAVQFTVVASPVVRGHGFGPINTAENPVVVEQTKAMMKLDKVDYSAQIQQTYQVSLPPIADKAVEKAWKDHVLTLTSQLQAAQAQLAAMQHAGPSNAVAAADAKEAESYFNALDSNRDGSLCPSELHFGLADCGFSEDEISSLILKLDVDGDGNISKREFIQNFGVYKNFTKMSI
eukprot:TRINITY_DN1265_c0_g1_i4.p1 TRINITY_DN1265_c0_g1~~TRINITY_DN1265_c0_g1_i4.p1  ORF type:complete len:697 (-),score=231.41 TRINITY_DN1265_c0_g1_i4:655-2745(-)